MNHFTEPILPLSHPSVTAPIHPAPSVHQLHPFPLPPFHTHNRKYHPHILLFRNSKPRPFRNPFHIHPSLHIYLTLRHFLKPPPPPQNPTHPPSPIQNLSPSPDHLSHHSTPTSTSQPQPSGQPSTSVQPSGQPSTSVQPSAQPTTFTQPPLSRSSAAAFFTPIQPQLETRLDSGFLLLQRISDQLSEVQASQQDGFRELAFRHDLHDINIVKAGKETSGDFLMHSTRIINEVNRCFAQGGPNMPYVGNVTAREDRLYKELRKAEDAAEKAAKGERDMRALNIRLLHEINDLRRQLNLSQYTNIPTDGDNYAAGQAEFDIKQRMKVAAIEEERYRAEQERINKMRKDSIFEATDDEL